MADVTGEWMEVARLIYKGNYGDVYRLLARALAMVAEETRKFPQVEVTNGHVYPAKPPTDAEIIARLMARIKEQK